MECFENLCEDSAWVYCVDYHEDLALAYSED